MTGQKNQRIAEMEHEAAARDARNRAAMEERRTQVDADYERRNAEQSAARRSEEESDLRARLRTHYLATAGATESDFAQAWPDLLREHRQRETLARADEAERPHGRYTF